MYDLLVYRWLKSICFTVWLSRSKKIYTFPNSDSKFRKKASYSPRPPNPTKEQKNYLNNEYYFYKSVKEEKRTTFFKGYRSKTSGKEKEVDVKLSVDLVGYGMLNKYNNAFLMTGDADFLQACHFLKIHKPSTSLTLLCMQNKIMYKGLFQYPSYIICTNKGPLKNIARRSICLDLKKTADLCPRLS